jgi:hypothetical protein
VGYVQADTFDGQTGAKLQSTKHSFLGAGVDSISSVPRPIDYTNWQEGREYQTDELDPANGNVLRTTVNTFTQDHDPNWWTGDHNLAPPNNPHLTATTLTLADTNQVSKQTFSYDQYSNETDESVFDFGAAGTGAPGPLLSHTATSYLATNVPLDGTTTGATVDYAATNSIHIQNLPKTVTVDQGGPPIAMTTYQYDQYTTGLTARSNIPRVSGLHCASSTSATALLKSGVTSQLMLNSMRPNRLLFSWQNFINSC